MVNIDIVDWIDWLLMLLPAQWLPSLVSSYPGSHLLVLMHSKDPMLLTQRWLVGHGLLVVHSSTSDASPWFNWRYQNDCNSNGCRFIMIEVAVILMFLDDHLSNELLFQYLCWLSARQMLLLVWKEIAVKYAMLSVSLDPLTG